LRGKKDSTTQQQQHTKYRSRHDICAAILKVVSGRQSSKTRLAERAFLCYSQNKEYMPILLENGLLTTTSEQQSIYKITDKGISFLELYYEINELLATETYYSPEILTAVY
jgi:predicted transcriptional regulator